MFRLTECSWIGIVMISMTSNTSITSINGVVLMSIITSGSCPPPWPTFIAILVLLSAAARRWLGHEADLLDACALGSEHDATDEFIATREVAADMDLRLRDL